MTPYYDVQKLLGEKPMRVVQLQEATGWSRTKVERILKELMERRQVKRVAKCVYGLVQ